VDFVRSIKREHSTPSCVGCFERADYSDIHDCYLGEAFNAGLFHSTAATFIGSARINGTSSCNWNPTSTGGFFAFSTNSACPGPTVIPNPGPGVVQTTDTDLPQITVNSLPAGTYQINGSRACMFGSVAGENYLSRCTHGSMVVVTQRFGTRLEPAASAITVTANFTIADTGNRTFSL
jgi:hypothetical protein